MCTATLLPLSPQPPRDADTQDAFHHHRWPERSHLSVSMHRADARIVSRYAEAEAFKRGEDFAVLELNGVTSESTNLYDPSWPLPRVYRTLFAQWSLCFAIGDATSPASVAGDSGALTSA